MAVSADVAAAVLFYFILFFLNAFSTDSVVDKYLTMRWFPLIDRLRFPFV